MHALETELKRYHCLNEAAAPDCAVFFGSDLFSGIPFGELSHNTGLDVPVYNRSIDGLSISEAERVINECVCRLNPSKVFVNLGEADLTAPDFDLKRFLTTYEWLLYTLNSRCHVKIFVVSILSDHPMTGAVNNGLRRLAAETGCTYVDISCAAGCSQPQLRIFDVIRRHLRSYPISISEAFGIAAV